MKNKNYFVYMLECSDDSFYTWITTDIEKRLDEHNWKLPWWAKYTSWRRPVKLLYTEQFATRSEACKREYEIKKFTKKQKLDLILNKKLW